jgi:quinol monooxygenase YgiN
MKIKSLILLISSAIVFANCNPNKSGEMNKSNEAQTNVQDTTCKMTIIAKLTIKPEKIAEFTTAAKEIIELSNKEAGCTFYQLYQDPYDNTKFVFVEEYKNQAAVDSHFATEHFKAFGPKIGDLVVGPPEIKIISVAKEVLK